MTRPRHFVQPTVASLLLLVSFATPSSAQSPQDRLWNAAQTGDTIALAEALGAGAQVDVLDTRRTPNGRFALNWAALGNHAAAIRFLVKRGAGLNAANFTGFTALHHAAEAGSVDAARALLELGADTTAKNGAGETALGVARRTHHLEVAALLQRGSKP